MDHVYYFENFFESIPHYGKIAFSMFLIKSGVDFLTEKSFVENDIICVRTEFQKPLMEQNREYFDHIRNKGESIYEKILSK